VGDNYLSPQREVTLGCGTSVPFPWGIPADIRRGGKEPSSNDPFPEADVAVIIMNRFVIKPVLAPPTEHNQLVEIPFPRLRTHPIINTIGKRTRACQRDQYRILYD
jgi:hypothetical protein